MGYYHTKFVAMLILDTNKKMKPNIEWNYFLHKFHNVNYLSLL